MWQSMSVGTRLESLARKRAFGSNRQTNINNNNNNNNNHNDNNKNNNNSSNNNSNNNSNESEPLMDNAKRKHHSVEVPPKWTALAQVLGEITDINANTKLVFIIFIGSIVFIFIYTYLFIF